MTSAVQQLAVVRGDGQAAAVDGDRVAETGVLEHGGGAHGEADRVALVLDGLDGAELLDDSGEHVSASLWCWVTVLGRSVKRTLGSSPSIAASTVTSVTVGRNASAMVVIPRSATAGRPAPRSSGAT